MDVAAGGSVTVGMGGSGVMLAAGGGVSTAGAVVAAGAQAARMRARTRQERAAFFMSDSLECSNGMG
jgi:hypothetical protein